MQMDGMPGTGHILGCRALLRINKFLRVVQQICTSIPIMKVMKLDDHLRKLLLAEMVQMHHADGLQLVIPEVMVV